MSILKIESIENAHEINSDDIIILKGITQEGVNSFGSIFSKLLFDNTSIRHNFQVVDNDFPIPSNGIIGKDFIFKYACILNYHSMNFTINLGDLEIKLPIQMGPSSDTIAIPPRTEVFRVFNIKKFKEPCLVEKCELSPGIFTADVIAYDDKPVIRILNTTLNTATVSNIVDKTIELSQFDTYSLNQEENSCTRNEKLRKILESRVPKAYAFQ